MKVLTIIGASLLLLGCAEEYARVPQLSQPWEIKGHVEGKEGEALPVNLQLVLLRLDAPHVWCLMCLGTYRPFAYAQVAADGSFYLSSNLPGDYSLRAYCPTGTHGVPLFEPLGPLNSGVRSVVTSYTASNCAVAR